LFIKTIFNDGTAHYIAKDREKSVAKISIRDGKLPGYSLVPTITNMNGSQEGLLFILDWMTSKVKSPLLSDLKYPLLVDFGFQHHRTGLIWDTTVDMEDDFQVVKSG
jgi:hypothetical protein